MTEDMKVKKLQVSIMGKTFLKGCEIKQIIQSHTTKNYPQMDAFSKIQLIKKEQKKEDKKEENNPNEANVNQPVKVSKKKKEKVLNLPNKKEYPLIDLNDDDLYRLPLIFPGPKLDSSVIFHFRCTNDKIDSLEQKLREISLENKKVLEDKFNNKKPKEKKKKKKDIRNRRNKRN